MTLTDEQIRKICSPTIYKHGLEYFKEGRVHLRVRKPDSIVAAVDGDELYNVHITFEEGKIKDTLCTCPYYRTMNCACKHIIATLKTRQAELDKTVNFDNENDLLASNFCSEFETVTHEVYRLSPTVRITRNSGKLSYAVSLKIHNNDVTYQIQSIELFLSCLSGGSDYKLSKARSFSLKSCVFDENSAKIADILTEAYENSFRTGTFFSSHINELQIGEKAFKRLFPLLEKVDCRYIIDSITYQNLPVTDDNPDILVDITATDKNINLSVTESGTALTSDGSLFMFENEIFKTTPEWQSWFMPIYRSVILRCRTQLEFSGENSIDFAAKVLPNIKDKHGVVCYGVDELVIHETPKFEVYLDRLNDGISARIRAIYGSIPLVIPCEINTPDKIIVRDDKAENNMLLFFSDFDRDDSTFLLNDDEGIFLFITEVIPVLKDYADVFLTDAFKNLTEAPLPEISTTVNFSEKIDLLELSVDSTLSERELADIFNAYYTHKRFYRFANGNFLDFKTADLPILSCMSDFTESSIKGIHTVSKSYALYLAQLARSGSVTADKKFLDMVDNALNSNADIPEYLGYILRDYQKTGVHWMHQLSELGLGGILADDMGLGKTLQVIAFVLSEKKKLPALVIAPSSLIYNWYNEIMKFAPSAKVKIIDGPKEERERLLAELDGLDFVITSYSLLRRDTSVYENLRFSFCFIDEAQHIKNHGTMNAIAVKQINADRYFALTGTPVENSLSELWSIFDFVLHGYLSTHKNFSTHYERPITKSGADNLLSELRGKIKPFILRRMKNDVLAELPEKIENTIFSDFEPEQKEIYSAFLAAARKEVSELDKTGENTIRILALLTRLRQICCHPQLIDPDYDKQSGKLKLLKEVVGSAVESGHRILVFSQFTSMLEIIQKALEQDGISCFYLDGSTPSSQRTVLVDRFNSGEKSVFLISLKAGGTGLNLVGADTVIHYDPWWNPAVMDQASDRAHRIGQTKAVQVIKLAARNSIEEQILKLAAKKRGLADGIIRENKNLLSTMSKEELMKLFE